MTLQKRFTEQAVKIYYFTARVQVLTAVFMKPAVFLLKTPYNLAEIFRRNLGLPHRKPFLCDLHKNFKIFLVISQSLAHDCAERGKCRFLK
jgi:hypothetical protein